MAGLSGRFKHIFHCQTETELNVYVIMTNHLFFFQNQMISYQMQKHSILSFESQETQTLNLPHLDCEVSC